MKCDPRLTLGGDWRITIGRRATVDIASQRDGKAEQAVLERLVFAQPDCSFVSRGCRLNVDNATRCADIARDIRPGRLAGSKCHRHGLRRRFQFVAFQLQHGPRRETDAVLSRQRGDESSRVSVVRPVSRSKQREFHRRIVLQLIELFVVDGLVVLSEEHRLAFAESAPFRKQARRDGPKLCDRRRLRSAGHGLSQRGIRRIEIRRQLHARHVERFGSLVETMTFAIFRQHVANVELRQLQHVAQILLVLVPIQPPQRSAPVSPDIRHVRLVNC